MLSHIFRLVQCFEQSHGVSPNLLYINHNHCESLQASFDGKFSLNNIVDMLQMEVIIESDSVHPHVAWTQIANKIAS